MRIVAGEWRGRQLEAPAGTQARPTTDRVKESMFHLIGVDWPPGGVLDLFAGSGALGLEALSRGAQWALFVDRHPLSIRTVHQNIRHCRAEERCEVWALDWRAACRRLRAADRRFSWVFADPPYASQLWQPLLEQLGGADGSSLAAGVACEHPARQSLADRYGFLQKWKSRSYGDIGVTLFKSIAQKGDAASENSHLPW